MQPTEYIRFNWYISKHLGKGQKVSKNQQLVTHGQSPRWDLRKNGTYVVIPTCSKLNDFTWSQRHKCKNRVCLTLGCLSDSISIKQTWSVLSPIIYMYIIANSTFEMWTVHGHQHSILTHVRSADVLRQKMLRPKSDSNPQFRIHAEGSTSWATGPNICYTDPAWLSLTNEQKIVD